MNTVVVHESMQAITDLKLELAELKEKVKEQEAIIRAQERMAAGTASKNGFVWKAAGVKPITYIRGCDGNPRFEEGWYLLPEFLKIAKKIHEDSPVFVQRPQGWYGDYWDNERVKLPKIKDLSYEQLEQSGEMLKKMIEIYNEYYIKNHRYATLIYNCGRKEIVPIKNV